MRTSAEAATPNLPKPRALTRMENTGHMPGVHDVAQTLFYLHETKQWQALTEWIDRGGLRVTGEHAFNALHLEASRAPENFVEWKPDPKTREFKRVEEKPARAKVSPPAQTEGESSSQNENPGLSRIQLLMHYGLSPAQKDFYGNTPLHHAISVGNLEALDEMLEKDPHLSLSVHNGRGETPLALAARAARSANEMAEKYMPGQHKRHVAVIDSILQVADKVDQRWRTPGATLAEAIQILKSTSPFPSGATPHSNRSRDFGGALSIAVSEGHRDATELLLHAGARLSGVPGAEATSSLLAAADHGHDDILRLLSQHGHKVDESVTKVEGHTALHRAVIEGHSAQAVALLVEMGAGVDLPARDETTALVAAARRGDPEVFRQVLAGMRDAYANPRAVAALEIAFDQGNQAIVEQLHDRGVESTKVPKAVAMDADHEQQAPGYVGALVKHLDPNGSGEPPNKIAKPNPSIRSGAHR